MKAGLFIMGDELTQHQPEIDDTSTTDTDHPVRVILFNDNVHTFDEVIDQLIKATGCSHDKAETYAWEVHTKGKAAVYEGTLEECMRVTSILEEIALHTQIEL